MRFPIRENDSLSRAYHRNPYKFLDYYNPEDADLFFGCDREIRQLEQKFYNRCLLVLHGESGAGKISLIRAGLIARLRPETYILVYVRMLQEPLQEVKRELDRQFERSARFSTTSQVSLVECLRQATESFSKTMIIVLDQFEEFFLRFSEKVQQQFTEEFSACVHTPRLDVKFLIALRSDYFSNLETFEQAIPQIFTHQVRLECLSEAQDAVLKPAQRMGIQVGEPMAQIKLLPDLSGKEGSVEPYTHQAKDFVSEGRLRIAYRFNGGETFLGILMSHTPFFQSCPFFLHSVHIENY